MTMIFDRLLGTFILENDEKIKFGITKDVNSHNPFTIWAFGFKQLLVDAAHAPGIGAKLLVFLGKPGETYNHVPGAKSLGAADDHILVAAE
jgi:hypothetical protein